MTVEIECAIARGYTASQIAKRLNVDLDAVHAVWDRLDALHRGEPEPKPELRPCGTMAGYERHKYRNEAQCAECREARAEYDRERRRTARKRVAECGTRSGYFRHRAKQEPSCPACLKAESEYSMHRRRARAAARVDEIEVEQIMRGYAPLTSERCGYQHSPELIEAIRRLVALRLSDDEIGERIGRTRPAVFKIRKRYDIPPGTARPGREDAA